MMSRMTFNGQQAMNMVHRSKEGNQLWLGDYYAASNLQLLKQKNIRSVLTSAAMLPISYPKDQQITHKVINAFDVPSYKMTPHFQEAFRFIDQALKKGNILVHCAAGISRSTTFVLVYLMRAENMSFEQALVYVQNKRSIICPNYGFQNQLKRYQITLKKQNPAQEKEKEKQKKQKEQKEKQKKSKESNFDTFAEKKAVYDFLNQQQKRPIKAQEKFNATLGGNRANLAQKVIGNKTGDYTAFLRGKSVSYQQKQRAPVISLDYKSKISNLAKGFSSYKMENPKIITIKK